MKTIVLVAAERREFDGIRKRLGITSAIAGSGAKFACEGRREGQRRVEEERWVMVANGPGRRLAGLAFSDRIMKEVGSGNLITLISTGFCGALDPKLRVGDIVVCEETPVESNRPFARGPVTTQDRVAVTAEEKRALRKSTGAIAVDMEAAAVRQRANELGIRYACIRVVSDVAEEDMPLDFNRYREADGDFSRARIALAAMVRPFSVMPALMGFDGRCKRASLALGDFLADCRF